MRLSNAWVLPLTIASAPSPTRCCLCLASSPSAPLALEQLCSSWGHRRCGCVEKLVLVLLGAPGGPEVASWLPT